MGLSNRQKEILVGTLLGDSMLEKNGRYVRLRIDHGGKQREYAKWKYAEFKNVSARKPRLLEVVDSRTGKIYRHWRFDTISTPDLVPFRKIFYNKIRKVIPKDISKLLKASLSLAVWFMDDGYKRKDCRGAYFNTQAYSIEEQYLLQKCLKQNFGVNTRIHWAAKRPRIYIPASQVEHFYSIINKEIILSMKYKVL